MVIILKIYIKKGSKVILLLLLLASLLVPLNYSISSLSGMAVGCSKLLNSQAKAIHVPVAYINHIVYVPHHTSYLRAWKIEQLQCLGKLLNYFLDTISSYDCLCIAYLWLTSSILIASCEVVYKQYHTYNIMLFWFC